MPNYRYHSPSYMQRNQRAGCPVCTDDNTRHDDLTGMALAMSYVPWQEWRNLYESEKGFSRGTIFAELDKPFLGKGGCCK